MNRRGHRKVIKRVLRKNVLNLAAKIIISEGYRPEPLTRLEKREWVKFQRHCDKILTPIVEEIIAEERMHGAPTK